MHHLTIQSYFCGRSIARSPNYLGIISTKQFDVERSSNTRQDPLRWSYWLSGEMYSQFESRVPMISDRFKFRPDPQWSHTGTLAAGVQGGRSEVGGGCPTSSSGRGSSVGCGLDLRWHAQAACSVAPAAGAVRLVLPLPDSGGRPAPTVIGGRAPKPDSERGRGGPRQSAARMVRRGPASSCSFPAGPPPSTEGAIVMSTIMMTRMPLAH